MWSIYTVDYYSAIKRNEAQTHKTPWVNLGNIPSEISQTQKTTCCMIPFI